MKTCNKCVCNMTDAHKIAAVFPGWAWNQEQLCPQLLTPQNRKCFKVKENCSYKYRNMLQLYLLSYGWLWMSKNVHFGTEIPLYLFLFNNYVFHTILFNNYNFLGATQVTHTCPHICIDCQRFCFLSFGVFSSSHPSTVKNDKVDENVCREVTALVP